MCTKNRENFILPTLRSFEVLLQNEQVELILVNNASTDNTLTLLTEFQKTNPRQIKVFTELNGGVSQGRNHGIENSLGEILAFTDDDCYPESDFLEKIITRFQNKDLGFLGGRVLLHDKTDLGITIQESNEKLVFCSKSYINPGTLHGANISIRRTALDAVGYFDVLLGPGTPTQAGEDIDLLNRLSAAGFIGMYDPDPTVSHHHRRKTKIDEIKISKSYDIGRGAYFLKGLINKSTRKMFFLPVIRRFIGHIVHRRLHTFYLELLGARIYWTSKKRTVFGNKD